MAAPGPAYGQPGLVAVSILCAGRDLLARSRGRERVCAPLEPRRLGPFDDSYVADMRDALREAIEDGTPQQKKALLKTLIAEIRVEGTKRAPIHRLLRTAVRFVGTVVGRSSYNANREVVVSGHRVNTLTRPKSSDMFGTTLVSQVRQEA